MQHFSLFLPTGDSGRIELKHLAVLGLGALAHALASFDTARSDAIVQDLTNAMAGVVVSCSFVRGSLNFEYFPPIFLLQMLLQQTLAPHVPWMTNYLKKTGMTHAFKRQCSFIV